MPIFVAVASLVAEHRLLGAWASVVAAHRLSSTSSVVVVYGISHSAACGILQDQASTRSLQHWQGDALPLSHPGSPLTRSDNHAPRGEIHAILPPFAPHLAGMTCSPGILGVFGYRILSPLICFPPLQDPMVYMNDKSPLVSHRETTLSGL